ncbi:hypothetical protein JTE90_013542 [Oedothorax gibbosus]|uniref:G-protein coupled receptors family 1 profile domain-containing protein n=1 Tax=Oedothorax gibbosus TaxID=931172 RepID=A0AAV6U894_9ARAC|nr:hypothetical protein JTE90_013542 [Oedothorax gibbosus]
MSGTISSYPFLSGKLLNISLSADVHNTTCNGTNETCNADSNLLADDVLTPEKFYWALLLIPFPLLAVAGNILVILSVYKEKNLQSVTNYFIVSLAFADLVVAAIAMPFAVYVIVSEILKVFS